jgi:hypothetical protein
MIFRQSIMYVFLSPNYKQNKLNFELLITTKRK